MAKNVFDANLNLTRW